MTEYTVDFYNRDRLTVVFDLVDRLRDRHFTYYRNPYKIENPLRGMTLYRLLRSKKLKKALLYKYGVYFDSSFNFYYLDENSERTVYRTYDPYLTIVTREKRQELANLMIKYENLIIIRLFYLCIRSSFRSTDMELENVKNYMDKYAKLSLSMKDINFFEDWSKKITLGDLI